MEKIVKVIPCLDVKDGRVVKGVNFTGFRDAGDPAEIAAFYSKEGADEIVFLDIAATNENRDTMVDLVKRTAEKINVPLAVGGGIRNLEDFQRVFDAGASKASVNSAAVKNPSLIQEAARRFGSEKIISAIDTRKKEGKYIVLVGGGLTDTDLDAVEWAKECERLGAGEILLTSFDCDGTKKGYDLEITKAIADAVKIPVTASGGAGGLEDLYEAVHTAGAAGVLAASLFHFRELTIPQVKEYLKGKGVKVSG